MPRQFRAPLDSPRLIPPRPVPPQGMVQTARYIRDKMASEHLLERAFSRAAAAAGAGAEDGDTAGYRLVLVGHSLGAGTAAILAILLRDQYPELRCFAYSPPGGLLRSVGGRNSRSGQKTDIDYRDTSCAVVESR